MAPPGKSLFHIGTPRKVNPVLSNVKGPLARKQRIVTALNTIGGDRSSAAYDEIMKIAPTEINKLIEDYDDEGLLRPLKKLFQQTKVPWTKAFHESTKKQSKASSSTSTSSQPASLAPTNRHFGLGPLGLALSYR